ncbi:Glycerol-3-phosphate ABC transporter, ATP-binding protein UgpC (TC 3.A.1.1.3) [Olavius sp. associated proteobacterium Delta 1]|nr:Glycerol-3-phosphate ABC transporter, ATP-binding protein UgpC (TC 3.A.1.1.3) [Olavius sp. associated proteobacterium Delta 1]
MSRIETHNLVKEWGKVRAVDGVSFHVAKGTLTVLLGPSGCGKSTILRMIAGLEEVTTGQITIGGQDITYKDAAKRGVSMVFQSYALFPHLNVRENILFGLKVRGVPTAERRKRLNGVAKMVGLEGLLLRKPANLSGGQRQRVALARSIVSQQPVCLMDEPLSNLDAKLRNEMRDEIRALQQKLGLTMIYVTHDQIEAMTMADQVVLLQSGRIEQIGAPHELYEHPETAFAAHFIGSPPMNLIRLDLVEDRTALSAAGGQIAVPQGSRGWSVGVRPEKIKLSERGLTARVGAIDFLGAETIIRLVYGEQTLLAKINGRAKIAPGDQLTVSWSPDAAHLFNEKGIREGG